MLADDRVLRSYFLLTDRRRMQKINALANREASEPTPPQKVSIYFHPYTLLLQRAPRLLGLHRYP